MEPDGNSPPFWSPSTAAILHHQRRRRRAPSPILSPVSLILLLPVLALLIIFFLLPPFLSHTSQLFRPTYSVKKSWDSLNILLVVFAILCGVFARRNDDVPPEETETSDDRGGPVSAADGDGDATAQRNEAARVARWFDAPVGLPEAGAGRLRRSSSSYPDLRQGLLWETGETRYRFLDDIDVDLYRQPAGSDHVIRHVRRRDSDREDNGIKVIPVDTFEAHSTRPPSPEPPPRAPTPPPPPPTPPANSKPRQPLHSVPRKEKVEKAQFEAKFAGAESEESRSPPPANSKPRQSRRRKREVEKKTRFEAKVVEAQLEDVLSPPPAAPPPPPPPPPPPAVEIEQFSERRLLRKKSGAAKEIATAIASLYIERKRKKKAKQRNSSGSSSENSPTNEHSYIPPPPPPPPPPSKVLQNLFKKSSKNKRVHSVPATAPPPPPPPPPLPLNSIFNNIFKTGSKSKRFNTSSSAPPPPPPPPLPPSSIFNTIFKQGSKSRRFKYETKAPPPPPPPPTQQVSSRRKSRNTHSQPPPTPPEPPRRRPSSARKPPLPAKPNTYYEEYLNSGSQSPLVPLPPPPPPPFKMPDFKFEARGDFVRILSAHSSRCSSPDRADLEDVEVMSVKSSEAMEGPDPIGLSVSCPSPDVNLKADSFIARLKGEWRLDKMNSLREKSTQ